MNKDVNRGSFIVLEGTDGSGKTTQLKLLAKQLRQDGHSVAVFDFPQYDLPSSYFVKRYLNGEYGSVEQVGPYTGALFYALDRYDVAAQIRDALQEGKVVLANRYTASSMAHQGAKFDNAEQRRGYFIWLDNLEFETLKIPRPDLNIVLRVPAEIAQALVDHKDDRSYTDKKRDLHEADLAHLQMAVTVYDDLCQLFPKDFSRIDCVRSNELLKPEIITKLVHEKVVPLLPKPRPAVSQSAAASPLPAVVEQPQQKPAAKAAAYYIPDTLSGKATVDFTKTIDELCNKRTALIEQLAGYLEEHRANDSQPTSSSQKRAETVLQGLMPVVCLEGSVVAPANPVARKLLDTLLPSTHTDMSHHSVNLISTTPRNELDTITQLLYSYSDVPFQELAFLAETWSYEQKAKILTLFLNETGQKVRNTLSPLSIILYGWDLVTDYGLFYELLLYGVGRELTLQTLSPRLGFEIPALIDDAGLTEDYEDCFDMSLQLYSRLQQAGYDNEAQYAALLGHKLRWSVTYSARELQAVLTRLRTLDDNDDARKLADTMHEKVSESHPILADSLSR